MDTWRDYLFAAGVLDKKASNPREDFRRIKLGVAARVATALFDRDAACRDFAGRVCRHGAKVNGLGWAE